MFTLLFANIDEFREGNGRGRGIKGYPRGHKTILLKEFWPKFETKITTFGRF